MSTTSGLIYWFTKVLSQDQTSFFLASLPLTPHFMICLFQCCREWIWEVMAFVQAFQGNSLKMLCFQCSEGRAMTCKGWQHSWELACAQTAPLAVIPKFCCFSDQKFSCFCAQVAQMCSLLFLLDGFRTRQWKWAERAQKWNLSHLFFPTLPLFEERELLWESVWVTWRLR